MFDLAFTEIFLVLLVAVIFIRPDDLPKVIRSIARGIARLKAYTREIRSAFDDIARESGIEEAQREINKEMQLILGDDGKYYEAYDVGYLDKLSPPKKEKPDE